MSATRTSSNEGATARKQGTSTNTGMDALRGNSMMVHLLECLERKQDIGHYGRLVFTMIARHFLDEDELVSKLCNSPGVDEKEAKALIRQVEARDYNPPRPERIREWQSQQDFQICPTDDPDACNVYRDLKFPDHIYENIQEYREKKIEADSETA